MQHWESAGLKLTDSASLANTQEDATIEKEHDSVSYPVEEPFDDLDVEDADYNPCIESEEDDDENELSKSER